MKWQLRFIQALSVAGLVVAFYLYLFHDGQILPACGSSGGFLQRQGVPLDCFNVSGPTAEYAAIGPFSIATIGMIGYAGLFLLVWSSDLLPSLQRIVTKVVPILVIIGFLFTAWLTWLEAAEIGAYCLYCLYSAAIMTVMFVLAVWVLVRPSTVKLPRQIA